MSINMTQAFKFETDDLESFEKMLRVIVEILYGGRKFGDHSKLHLQVKNQHYGFPDGKDYHASRNEQPEMLAEGGKYFALKPQRVYGGAFFVTKDTSFTDKDKAARFSCSKWREPKATRMWIATFADYIEDFDHLKKDERIYCASVNDAVKQAMEVVRAVDPKVFFEKFGDGYHYAFNRFDGSIGHGYRMEWSPSGASDHLHLSMIHAYYGK